MKEVRAPFAYTAFKQIGVTAKELRSSIGFQAGFRINVSQLLSAAERYDLDMSMLMPDVAENINLRFREKLRGNLASYLFENDGAFRGKTSDSQMKVFGLDACGEIALPNRIVDAIHLEELLNNIIDQAQAMQKMIDQKFSEAEHKVVFRTQCAPGMFRLRTRYPRRTASRNPQQQRRPAVSQYEGKKFTVNGVEYQFLSQLAREIGVGYHRLYRHVKALNTPLTDLTPEQWNKCISRAKETEGPGELPKQEGPDGQQENRKNQKTETMKTGNTEGDHNA